ncbi:MAG TPA: Tn3 family transposase [Pyrinomonadaceae bacterium]|nr:Tn3 family transposase [Pyrinomonadaceae bacterium]
MASIERTTYPRIKQTLSKSEIQDFYTPTLEEKFFVRENARNEEPQLHLLVQLKCFQRLGYFPNLEDVPDSVVKHLRSALMFKDEIFPLVIPRTLYRHQAAVRKFLGVKSYDKTARKLIVKAVYQAANVMDNPADLINVAIEDLIKERYELPAYSTLDRLVGRIRSLVNRRLFHTILRRLSEHQISTLERLTEPDSNSYRTPYNSLKELPKKATLKHLQELINHLDWLIGIGDFKEVLRDVPPLKIKHFYAQAKALDAREIKDFADPKRLTLLVCLTHRAQIKARDALIEMFIKRMAKLHQKGRDALDVMRLKQMATTEKLLTVLSGFLQKVDLEKSDAEVGKNIKNYWGNQNLEGLIQDCEAVSAFFGNNYFQLIWQFYRSHRQTLFRLIKALEFTSTSNDQSLIQSLEYLIESENRKSENLESKIDLDFAAEKWKLLVLKMADGLLVLDRKHFEVCVFSYLGQELKSGDIAIPDSEEYADYRHQLLAWDDCAPLIKEFCAEMNLPDNPLDFVGYLKKELQTTAEKVDQGYPKNSALTIDEKGNLILRKIEKQEVSGTSKSLELAIADRMPERNLIDILSNVQFHTNWMRHFGPLSGSDPKLQKPIVRYLLTLFTYGCNLGPAQAARHMRGIISAHMLSFVNRRHINADKLNLALVDLLDNYHRFRLPKFWGDGKHAAADGTKYDLSEQNLMAEYHIRYGGYGGIAYHHVSDLYVALFSHFINCGTWEAVYIIDGLLKNDSEIQPDTLNADTQGQSTTVFGLSYLLGINLQPRIRNIKNLIFYRAEKKHKFKHIDALFSETIDWDLIETHWKDLMQVVLSIKVGKILPSTLLRKLGNYSCQNRLYLAFRELGRVIRTIFLLKYISDKEFREEINANTNKVEAYNGFSKWLNFGGEILQENDPEEQEKLIKYNTLVANALIFQNVIDQTRIIQNLKLEEFEVKAEDLKILSPYLTAHIKRFGDYVVDLTEVPPPLDIEYTFSI